MDTRMSAAADETPSVAAEERTRSIEERNLGKLQLSILLSSSTDEQYAFANAQTFDT